MAAGTSIVFPEPGGAVTTTAPARDAATTSSRMRATGRSGGSVEREGAVIVVPCRGVYHWAVSGPRGAATPAAVTAALGETGMAGSFGVAIDCREGLRLGKIDAYRTKGIA
jgi:hypothetical protein